MAIQTKTKTAAKTEAPAQAPTGNLPAVVQKQMSGFMAEVRARQRAYVPLLPPHVSWEKFQASVRAAITKDPELVTKCIPATLFRACAEAAELGLSLNPTLKHADIVKVWNTRLNGLEAQFRPRYQGYMVLAKQSGEIQNITAHEVYEWDEFDYAYGLDEHCDHKPGSKPADYDKLPFWGITHAYCIWTEADGTKKFEVMDLQDLIRIMSRTQSKNREGQIVGPWITDKPEMCRKTVVRRASKYMPLSAEKMKPFAAAVNLDDRREGGEQVTLKDGDVMDITDFGDAGEDAPQAQETQAGKSQMDDLEARMGKPQPRRQATQQQAKVAPQPKAQPQTIENPPQPARPKQAARIEVPRSPTGGADWITWLRLSEAAVQPLDTAARTAWRAKHKDLLDACEFNEPQEMETLLQLLPTEMETLLQPLPTES